VGLSSENGGSNLLMSPKTGSKPGEDPLEEAILFGGLPFGKGYSKGFEADDGVVNGVPMN
jgi:hypothetical protein